MPEIKHKKKKSSMLTPQGWWESPIAGKIHWQSSYEKKFCAFADEHKLNWRKNKERFDYVSPFDNKVHKYIPDFIVVTPEGQELYIEVKGMVRKADPAKFEAFPEDKKLVLLGCKELRQMGLDVFDPEEFDDRGKRKVELKPDQWPYKLLQNMPDFWERGVMTEELTKKVDPKVFMDLICQ